MAKKSLKLAPLMIHNPFEDGPRLPEPFGDLEKWSWTQSAVKQFRRCKRKFYWKYILGLKPKTTTAALWIGTIFHQVVAKWYAQKRSNMISLAQKEVGAMEAELQETMSFYDQSELDKIQAAMATFVGMCEGYARVHGEDRKKYTMRRELIEKQFKIDMGDFFFEGSIDQMWYTKAKKPVRCMVERKTASTVTESYIERLALDTQTRGYLYAAKKIGLPCSRVIYDVTKKCKLRRKSNEAQEDYEARIITDYEENPDKYFIRENLRFSQADLNAFELELRQVHSEFMHILESADDPRDPRAWGIDDQECNAFFRICNYQCLCLRGLDQGASAGFVQSESMHVELEADQK